MQWVADFTQRIQQLERVSQAANTGGPHALKVRTYIAQSQSRCVCAGLVAGASRTLVYSFLVVPGRGGFAATP